MKKIKIARVVTVPFTLISLVGLFQKISSDDRFELHIITTFDSSIEELKKTLPNVIFHDVEISREINVKKDFSAMWKLLVLIKQEKYSIVHSHTPKAGLLAAIASRLSGVPFRIHTFTGQVWVEYKGVKRFLFKKIDQIICQLNTLCYADSFGQKDFLVDSKITTNFKIRVLESGSIAGIDLKKFSYDEKNLTYSTLRNTLFPKYDGKIILFLGRINADKGLEDLCDAFLILKDKYNIKLLIVGPDDHINISLQNKIDYLLSTNLAKKIGLVNNTVEYYAVSDIYCLPSYREGCPTSILEASAMKKAVVASDIYGIRDIVIDKETALIFKVKDVIDLKNKIELLLNNQELSVQLGLNGREFVSKHFSQELLTKAMVREYEELLGL